MGSKSLFKFSTSSFWSSTNYFFIPNLYTFYCFYLSNPKRKASLRKNYQFLIVLWEMTHRNENRTDTEKRENSIKEKFMAIFDSTNSSDFSYIFAYLKWNRQIQYNISTIISSYLIIFLHIFKDVFLSILEIKYLPNIDKHSKRMCALLTSENFLKIMYQFDKRQEESNIFSGVIYFQSWSVIIIMQKK